MMDEIFEYEPSADEDFYSILGCDPTSTVEQIRTEYKIRSLNCHPDKNPNNASCAREFQKLQAAKAILLDEDKRRLYDQWRTCGVAISWKQFYTNKQFAAMHWHSPPVQPSMIKETDKEEKQPPEAESSRSIIDKFRNYEV